MNVGHVKGSGGVDPSSNQPEKARKSEAPVTRGAKVDEARISEASREALELEARALRESGSRREKVESAREKLQSGELDQPQAHEETARRLLGMGDEPEF